MFQQSICCPNPNPNPNLHFFHSYLLSHFCYIKGFSLDSSSSNLQSLSPAELVQFHFLVLSRKVPHSFSPQVDLYYPMISTTTTHLLVLQESVSGWCPSALSEHKENVDRLQYCPEHSLLLISKTQKLFGEGMHPWILIIERLLGYTRCVSGKQRQCSDFQLTVAHAVISLLSAPRTSIKGMIKFHQVPYHAQFIFPHNCKMW